MQMRVPHPIWEIYGNLVLLLLFSMTILQILNRLHRFAMFCFQIQVVGNWESYST